MMHGQKNIKLKNSVFLKSFFFWRMITSTCIVSWRIKAYWKTLWIYH